MSVHPSECPTGPTGLSGLPALRLLPAPPSEPPYDDELTARSPTLHLVGAGPPSLALAPALAWPPAATPWPGPPGLRLVRDLEPDDGPARTSRADLPSPRPFAQALVQRLLEVLAGLRPLAQLQRDTSTELFEQLERTVLARPRPVGRRPTRRDVRSLHVQERDDAVAEVCATVRHGGRAGAVALRLEGIGGGWRCTAITGL